MTCDATVESAERASRGRALLMAIAAAVLLLSAALQIGDPDYVGPGVRGGSWVVLVGLWMFILAHGGGLRLGYRQVSSPKVGFMHGQLLIKTVSA